MHKNEQIRAGVIFLACTDLFIFVHLFFFGFVIIGCKGNLRRNMVSLPGHIWSYGRYSDRGNFSAALILRFLVGYWKFQISYQPFHRGTAKPLEKPKWGLVVTSLKFT